MFTADVIGRVAASIDCCPWGTVAGRSTADSRRAVARLAGPRPAGRLIYTAEQRRRRDASPWTLVQGILAPLQFAVFALSLGFVIHYLLTGNGFTAATASVVVKTAVLYTIMITGSIWEREVFGRYLFAPAFFWEDVVSMVVLALHTMYLGAVLTGTLDAGQQMTLALAAYGAYFVNAVQFVGKLRAARREQTSWQSPAGAVGATR
jgi:3-vinyl bacteriochlorophyllide hydratase